jgi:hypothetical protein
MNKPEILKNLDEVTEEKTDDCDVKVMTLTKENHQAGIHQNSGEEIAEERPDKAVPYKESDENFNKKDDNSDE